MTTAAAVQRLTEEELKKIDAIVLVDRSGSMKNPSLRLEGRTRYDEVMESCISIARDMEKFDSDGITVIHFNGDVVTHDNVTASKVAQIFEECEANGGTNLTEALQKAVDKAKSSKKETVVIIYTDGEPDSATSAMRVIDEAGNSIGRPRIGFTFIQVGESKDATAFLDKLDNGMKVDVCATLRAKEAEPLGYAQLAWLARNK